MLSIATDPPSTTGIPAEHIDWIDGATLRRRVALWLVLFILICSIVNAIDRTKVSVPRSHVE